MSTRTVSIPQRVGQLFTGLGALFVLAALLVGAPLALATFAGNPLPDHVPHLDEVVAVLTSRDDGQLFLRALAIVGWAGWATFALSVLVELPARALRRPAWRLPGLRRQQQAAAALIASTALLLLASPAAAAEPPAAPAAVTAPGHTGSAPRYASAATGLVSPHLSAAKPASPAAKPASVDPPIYRVEKGDYLGTVAKRYLDDFDRYPELARLNKIKNPDRIFPGQRLRLPNDAADRGVRPHATGLAATPPSARGVDSAQPESARPAPGPDSARPAPAPTEQSVDTIPAMVTEAARPTRAERVNRPLAISAVLAVASTVGAQVGAVLGIRRTLTSPRSATKRGGTTRVKDGLRRRA